jgi:hypothetical protein
MFMESHHHKRKSAARVVYYHVSCSLARNCRRANELDNFILTQSILQTDAKQQTDLLLHLRCERAIAVLDRCAGSGAGRGRRLVLRVHGKHLKNKFFDVQCIGSAPSSAAAANADVEGSWRRVNRFVASKQLKNRVLDVDDILDS